MSDGPRPFPLQDSDWKRLSRIAGLPEAARPELANILGRGAFLADLDSKSPAPYETCKSVAAIRQMAEDLLAALSNCGPDVLMAITDGDDLCFGPEGFTPPPRMTRHLALEEDKKAVKDIAQRLHLAERRIPKGQTGNKTMAAHVVTRGIDELLFRHKGVRLTATDRPHDPGKEFLDGCLELLKMGVKADTMIRKRASERRKVSAEEN